MSTRRADHPAGGGQSIDGWSYYRLYRLYPLPCPNPDQNSQVPGAPLHTAVRDYLDVSRRYPRLAMRDDFTHAVTWAGLHTSALTSTAVARALGWPQLEAPLGAVTGESLPALSGVVWRGVMGGIFGNPIHEEERHMVRDK